MIFLILIVFSVCCMLAGYYVFILYQRRSSSQKVNRVSIEFKRPPNAAAVAANHSASRSRSVKPIDNVGSSHHHVSPTVSSYIRNRNHSEFSRINYISPNSMYGNMPRTNLLSDRSKTKELKKEFTVKLSPFPQQINRSILSPNVTINSPTENKSFNRSTLNGSVTQKSGLPKNNTSVPRQSNKRPMFSNDDSESEHFVKKSKNQFETFDLDDEEMFEDASSDEIAIINKKAVKRSTYSFENDLPFNSPQKRIKNNEILSSYSSTSVSQNMINKRKFSPEEAVTNNKVKKRTYIEELELLNSDMSPYFRDSTPKTITNSNLIVNEEATNIMPNTSTNNEVSHTYDDKKNTKEQVDINNGIEIQIDTTEANLEDDAKQTDDCFYPIPAHIFSIKDHEYDKKKSKNRLDRFLSAVQQANEMNTNLSLEKKTIDSVDNASFTKETIVPAIEKPLVSSVVSENNIAVSTAAPITTTIVLSEDSKTLANSANTGIEKLPSNPVSLASPIGLSFSTSNPPTISLAPINFSNSISKSTTSTLSSAPVSSPFSLPSQPSIVSAETKPQSSLNFNFSAVNANSLTAAKPITSAVNSTPFNPQAISNQAGLSLSRTIETTVQQTPQAPSVGFNFPVSSNSFAAPKISLNNTPSTDKSIIQSSTAINTSQPIVPSLSLPPATSNFTSFSNPAPIQQVKPSGIFNFAQTQAITSKAGFDFTQTKPSFNSLSTLTTGPSTINNQSPFAFTASNNPIAVSTFKNEIKTASTTSSTQNVPSLSTTPAFNFNTPAPAVNLSNNMFKFNTTAPKLTSNPTQISANGLSSRQPSVSFDFKPAQSSTTTNVGGFNFSSVAPLTTPGFNFGQQASTSSTGFAFGAAPVSSTITSPLSFPQPSNPTTFTFGASNSTAPMFQFNSK